MLSFQVFEGAIHFLRGLLTMFKVSKKATNIDEIFTVDLTFPK